MSRQQSERSIPHLRDIFGLQSGWGSRVGSAVTEDAVQQKLQDLRLGGGHDSAVSVGSASEDEQEQTSRGAGGRKKKQRPSRRDGARTLTERDVKHLERHLSMKKTIRKKIMRDLQQAFVENPDEFRVEDIPPEQLKAEISAQSLSFGAPHRKKAPEPTFLDMLRGGKLSSHDDDDSGHGSPTRESPTDRLADCEDDDDGDYCEASKKTSFWRRFTMKGRSKR